MQWLNYICMSKVSNLRHLSVVMNGLELDNVDFWAYSFIYKM